jgi:ABC-type nitrate/sulfonate/bicarbonate transport system permease component
LEVGRLPSLAGARPNPNATLLGHLGASRMCLAAAFVVTVVLGVPLGLTSRAVREIVDP